MSESTLSKFKTWHKVFFIILIVSFVGLKLWQSRWPLVTVELGGQVLEVQVADTIYHMYKGLGDRESIGKYDGMLFLFDFPGKQGIVMRDMQFPIDIVWFYEGEIVDMAQNIQPEGDISEAQLTKYYPRVSANIVLELPAGWAAKNGVGIGDRLQLLSN